MALAIVKVAHPWCGPTYSLVVERHQLAASVPEELRHVVGGVHSGSFGVNTTQLGLIISGGEKVKELVLIPFMLLRL